MRSTPAKRESGSAIIRSFAYKSFSIMTLGVERLKRFAAALVAILCTSLILISCGGYGSNSTSGQTSNPKFRAFVSQDIATAILSPGLIIIDAQKDQRAAAAPVGGAGGFEPAMMVISNDHKLTVSVSSSATSLQVVDNAKQTQTGVVTLPGTTESVLISGDNATGYAAVPTAPVPGGGSAGGIAIANLTQGGAPNILPIPGAHYL
ncbi:MAG TPA: hypothetical protein VK554_06090, partial [Bradyrhizobium sp.]|nr:hypothetical protein [Bradyrhizobium sp.]